MSQGLRVELHPLPILNISEHLTRVTLQQNDMNATVVGGLLGTQTGRDVEIMNTFELVVESDGQGQLSVDHAYFVTRRDQFKQVFPTFDFLGWYTIGSEPTADNIALHKQFFQYNETPLFLQFSKEISSGEELPLTIYESVMEIVADQPEVNFVKISYEIETGEAERVAVDHASKPSTTGTGAQSTLVANLTTQFNAIKMLHERVSIIVQYLQAVTAGTAVRDEETLRQISALLTSLPATDSLDFKHEFMTEYNDVLLTTYLATLTKQLASANTLLDKQMLLVASNGTASQGPGRMKQRTTRSSDFH